MLPDNTCVNLLCAPWRSRQGVALMMVLWVMAFLSVIIAEFAFSMRTELKIAGNFKEETENYYRAQAAVQQAMTEILNPRVTHHYLRGGELVFGLKQEGELEAEEAPAEDFIPKREDIPLGSGYFSYRIEDEGAKIYLNRFANDTEANRQILARLLEKGAGISEGTEQDAIIDCIIDWLDKDDLHKINGAEDDYYRSLDPPYECKDGPFDTVEELLLVKGITPEILLGGEGSSGIAKFLTVWGGSFNPYTADQTTRDIMYGEEAAEKEDALYDEFGQPTRKHKSRTFSIIGRGESQVGAGQRLIRAVVAVSSKHRAPSLRISYWNDNLFNYSWPQGQEQLSNEDLEYYE